VLIDETSEEHKMIANQPFTIAEVVMPDGEAYFAAFDSEGVKMTIGYDTLGEVATAIAEGLIGDNAPWYCDVKGVI